MSDADTIRDLFNDQRTAASSMADEAKADIQKAFNALGTSGIYKYEPYKWDMPPQPLIGGISTPAGPAVPQRPLDPMAPRLVDVAVNVPNPSLGAVPVNKVAKPDITLPTVPSGEPQDTTGNAPVVRNVTDVTRPTLLTLPSTTLPYGSVAIPNAPTLVPPSFTAVAPGDLANIDLDQYLRKFGDAYTDYSQRIPALVKDNWLAWFRAMVNENPNIRTIDNIVTTYTTLGGAGIPVPIEEAIVTRATDRASAEYRRKNADVWESAAQQGLTLPSGTLQAGRKAARAEMAEAVAKVGTDVAIKNLELEHDHMKFMLQLGVELQKLLLTFASDNARVVAELNGQAVDMAKATLTAMVEVQNTIVKIWLAKWDGYKAAVEVFRAKIAANEQIVSLYEAEIKAELAKTEVNKAQVAVLEAVVQANNVLTQMYKTQIDAETAKLEADRVRVLAYEATVRGYLAKVDAYKARWEGYRAGVDGQLAVAKVYEAEQQGYRAEVDGFTAGVNAYKAQVEGFSAQVHAVATQNEAALKAWGIQWDGTMKAYSTSVDAYGRNWSAIGEQMRAQANVLSVQSEFLTKMYSQQTLIQIELSREHFSNWQGQLRAALDTASGMTQASGVAAGMANSALNSLTAFAGSLTTSQS